MKISRRKFFKKSLHTTAALSIYPIMRNTRNIKQSKPNILLIITDHQAYYDHRRTGEFNYNLDVFDRFCKEGIRFNRAYSVSPLCSPARASILTGLFPHRHGLIRNTDYSEVHELKSNQELYSDYLSKSGYKNYYYGKWHCGKHKLPKDYNLEGWSLPDYGKVYMSDAYQQYALKRKLGKASAKIEHNLNHPEWRGKIFNLHHSSPWHFMNGCGVLQGPPEAHEEYFVAHLVRNKLRELSKQTQPWSMVASFWGPHHPYFPTEPFAGRINPSAIPEYPSFNDTLEDKPFRHILARDFHHRSHYKWPDWTTWQSVLARAYEQGIQTDAAIGGILDDLEKLGMKENTLVIWVADHGDAVASHGGLWDKASTYIEEVARVPLAIRWPSVIDKGLETNKIVSNMDITSTILEATNIVPTKKLDSRSLLDLCNNPRNDNWFEFTFAEHHGHGDDIPQRIIICDQYKYVAALYDQDELYDLKNDPYEFENLVNKDSHSNVKSDLRKRLIEHIETTDDNHKAHKIAHALKNGRY